MAAHKLPRLSKSLLDTPQLITESKFREIAEVLENRDSPLIKAAMFDPIDDDKDIKSIGDSQGFGEKIGVLEVEGPLTFKPTGWEMLCGTGCSYTSLMDQIDTFAEKGIKTVVMMVDSPGGQAFRCFSSSRYIKKVCDENDIRLVGYVNGQACSGGIALAAGCSELVSNPDSELGSIGVVVSLTSTSEKDKKEGIKREFITAGKSKVPFDEDGNFKEEFKEDLQSKINKTYDNFVNHISEMRGIDPQVVRDTEAKVFDAEDSLSLGLIDSIMEEDEFKKYIGAGEFVSAQQLRQYDEGEELNVVENTQPKIETKEEQALMSDLNITAEQLAEMQATLESQAEQLAAFQAKEMASQKASVVEKLEGMSFLADFEGKEALAEFILTAEDSQKELMNSVIEAATLENQKVLEQAATDIASKEEELTVMKEALDEAKVEVETAKAEALRVKEEFGKGEAIEGDVKDKHVAADAKSGQARTAQLAALVKQKQANK